MLGCCQAKNPQFSASTGLENCILFVVMGPTFTSSSHYSNAAAIMMTIPALPAYIELSDEAAPMKFAGTVDEACVLLALNDATVEDVAVPTARVVLLYAE